MYEEHYGAQDPWRPAVLNSPSSIGTSESVLPLKELQQTEIYNDVLHPYEIPHALFKLIERSPSRVASVAFYRSARLGPFQEENVAVIRYLSPHMERAYRLHAELVSSRQRNAGLVAVLNLLSTGVILLGPSTRIVSMNRSAEQLMAQNDGLGVRKMTLEAKCAGENTRLTKLIADAIATSEGIGASAGGAAIVSRRALPPLQVLVSPVRGWDLDEVHRVRAAVFITDPASRARPSGDALRSVFKLTGAECRLAMLLADGHAPPDISAMVGVTRNTLKSQLASIYRKTGTTRQSQLVRLLLQIAVPAIGSPNVKSANA